MIIFINLYWEILTKRADSALYINQFLPNIPFLYTLKTSEERRFSYIFRKYTLKTSEEKRFSYIFRKYTLKTSEEKRFSYIFRKYKKGKLGGNGLINITEYKTALTLQCVTSQNGQVHFKNLAAFAAIFLKCV